MRRRMFLQSLAATTLAGVKQPSQGATINPRPYRRISCEEAFTIPEILDASRRHAKGAASMSSGPIVGPMLPLLMDLGNGRLHGMDAAGIDMQVLSLVSPGVQNFAAADAVSLARLANDRLAEACKAHPARFAGLASIAPQDPSAAATELQRAKTDLGLKGLLINSHTQNEYLDNPKFWPILEAAEALSLPLYIHPREPSAGLSGPLTIPGFTVGWGYAVETGTHALRLISAGVFDRFPKLKVILGHMGEGIPFFLERIDNRYRFETAMFERRVKLQRMPGDYFRENFLVTTSGMIVQAPLMATISTLGIERVLFAVDYPFEDQPAAVVALEAMPLSVDDKRKICETNVVKAFDLKI